MSVRSQTSRIYLSQSRPSLVAMIGQVIATRRERAALAKLDARLLDDIGVSPRDAWSEARRPLWEQADRHNR